MGGHLRFSTVFYMVIAIAAYFAWSSSVMISSALWPSASPFPLKLNWVLNLIGHGAMLGVLTLLAPKVSPLGKLKMPGIAAATLISLSTFVLAIGFAHPSLTLLCAPASFLSGACMGVMLFIWGGTLIELRAIEVQHLIIEGAIIAGMFFTVVIICLPPYFGLAVSMALPFAIPLCDQQVRRRIQLDSAAPSEDAGAEGAPFSSTYAAPTPKDKVFSKASPLIRLLLCCLVLALPAGMYQSGDVSMPSAQLAEGWRTLVACNCVFVTLAVLLDNYLSQRMASRLFSRLIVPLMAGGLLIMSAVGTEFETWGSWLMQMGYQLFLIYIYTEFAYAADVAPSVPIRVFGMGTLAIDTGLFLGFAGVSLTSHLRADWVQGAILAAVYLLLLVGILIFPSVVEQVNLKAKRRVALAIEDQMLETDASSKNGEAPSPHQSLSTLRSFAEAHGLSTREQEILQQLATGRTLPSIATEAHLSYNTVKTHVSHIYQKAGVHTRDELLDALEGTDES